MGWYTLLKVFLYLLLLVLITFLVVRPVPLKYVVRKAFYTPDYEYAKDADVELHPEFTLYKSSDRRRNASLIVIVIGGAFIFNNLNTHYGFANEIWRRTKDTHDVMLVRYPIRFSYTLRDSMNSLNESLSVARDNYETRHLVSVSAGTLLAGTFLKKEREPNYAALIDVKRIGVSFRTFVGINGVYDTEFRNPIVSALFKFYVLRGTKNGEKYSAMTIDVPSLAISSRNDFLYSQTDRFVRTNDTESLIYDAKLPHSFVQIVQLPQSQEAIGKICDFVRKHEKKSSNEGAAGTTETASKPVVVY